MNVRELTATVALFLGLAGQTARAATLYVDANSAYPAPPYTNWASAANSIQDAVDTAQAGDLVLVTNGVYGTGGRVVFGFLTNRVAVPTSVAVRSVNGPGSTIIQGYGVPGTVYGNSAVRCVYLAAGASLQGFTLTQGATRATAEWWSVYDGYGGGACCYDQTATVSECLFTSNAAALYGGGVYGGTILDSTIATNTAFAGGGASHARIVRCRVSANSASDGGGVYLGDVSESLLTDNFATENGGGSCGGTNFGSTIVGNTALKRGGGVSGGRHERCTLTENSAAVGGGSSDSSLRSCQVTFNRATEDGGGCKAGYLSHCTVTGNIAHQGGGGSSVDADNCILFHNRATVGRNHDSARLDYCCTEPLPSSGAGNFSADPELADLAHLSGSSPCRGAGGPPLPVTLDIDGEPWLGPASVGCDEFSLERATGALAVVVRAVATNVAIGFPDSFEADTVGHATRCEWSFGDGTPPGNGSFVVHAWALPGDYPVTVRVFNLDHPTGVSASIVVRVRSVTHFVDPGSTAPAPPYDSWSTAAHQIQDAVDAATLPGAVVLVTNGVYQSGERTAADGLPSRVAITAPLIVRSINGPSHTVIQGKKAPELGPSVRCVSLASDATLEGFTLTGGGTAGSGGGAFCESTDATITNCVITGNEARGVGGGVYAGTLHQCALTTNTAHYGGGVADAVLVGCTLSGNDATTEGGGAYRSVLLGTLLTANGSWLSRGGGAIYSDLFDCTLANNRGHQGGGAIESRLSRCTLARNVSYGDGGGASRCRLQDCRFDGNDAQDRGGGASESYLTNCTLTANSAYAGGGAWESGVFNSSLSGNYASFGGAANECTIVNCSLIDNAATYAGGVWSCRVTNSIAYYNASERRDPNHSASILDHCCSTPLPLEGSGNIDAIPELASLSHLALQSPCRGAGRPGVVALTDIDGEPWASPPSIGCDELIPGQVTGPVAVAIRSDFTNLAAGFECGFKAQIDGRVHFSRWDFGDGSFLTNQPFVAHAWSAAGDFVLTLTAYNEDHPDGVSATVIVHVIEPPLHFVSPDAANPVAPYDSWETAASNIQDAVDAATFPGAHVVVTNGIYASGGRAVGGVLTNRVSITRPMLVRSVNGPAFTVIEGAPGITNDVGAVRCAYLTDGASLQGFTLRYGGTLGAEAALNDGEGGGAWCRSPAARLSRCVVVDNSAPVGGGVSGGTVEDSVLEANFAFSGGGAHGAVLLRCDLLGNHAAGAGGGGAYYSTLSQCTLARNTAANGAGALNARLVLCTLDANAASGNGGGAMLSVLHRCTLVGNRARIGGGAEQSTLTSCLVRGNSANDAGGADGSNLSHCTVTGNSASRYAGGVGGGTLCNSIVYYNSAPTGPNHYYSLVSSSCTTPLPADAIDSIDSEPQLASASHLGLSSPCRGAGDPSCPGSSDLDGEPWAVPPSMGCDEPVSGQSSGPLTVAIGTAWTNVAAGAALELTASIHGQVERTEWDFADGSTLTNRPYATHAWTTPGIYTVAVTAFNASYPQGVGASITIRVLAQPVHHVWGDSPDPTPPFDSWTTAAHVIQDAVDSVSAAGALVLVTNGVYATGGRTSTGMLTNRVVVGKPIALRSVNGPAVTFIDGYQVPEFVTGPSAIRCVYLTNNAVVDGFTLRFGATLDATDYEPDTSGGGVCGASPNAFVTNCFFASNSAVAGGAAFRGTLDHCTFSNNRAVTGGGAFQSALQHCLLQENTAGLTGGGACESSLEFCTLTGNTATEGGGAYMGNLQHCLVIRNSAVSNGGGASDAALGHCAVVENSARDGGGTWGCRTTNSIVYFNSATNGSPNIFGFIGFGFVHHSCSTPLSTDGVGNIDAPPRFVDPAGGDFHLQSLSPCINAGDNRSVTHSVDLGLEPRVVGGTVDIGPYEFQTPTSAISYAWLQHYGLPTDGSADAADDDADSRNNFEEWRCDTDPTNRASHLQLLSLQRGEAGITIHWDSSAQRSYFIERSSQVGVPTDFMRIAVDLPGEDSVSSFTDTNASALDEVFYRVGVE